jgi:hypothetical protein
MIRSQTLLRLLRPIPKSVLLLSCPLRSDLCGERNRKVAQALPRFISKHAVRACGSLSSIAKHARSSVAERPAAHPAALNMLARPTPRSEQLGVYGILRLAKVFNIRYTLSPGSQLGTEILILFCRGILWNNPIQVCIAYSNRL